MLSEIWYYEKAVWSVQTIAEDRIYATLLPILCDLVSLQVLILRTIMGKAKEYWAIATNSDFVIHLSLQPNKVLYLRYLKFKISQAYAVRLQIYRDLKIRVCDKDSISLSGYV